MSRRNGGLSRAGFLLLACALACGGGSADPDAAVAADGKICVPEDHRICEDGNAYWADSCGGVGELIATCTAEKTCDNAVGNCCFPAATAGTFSDAPVLTQVALAAPASAAELRFDLELVTFSILGQAQAFSFVGSIDGSTFRIAVRADLADSGAAFGPGIAFVGGIQSEDPSNVDYGPPVFFDSSAETGGSVRLSRPTELASRIDLAVRLSREENQGGGDWFALYVAIDGGTEELLGRILFPRQGGSAAAIDSAGNTLAGSVSRDNEFALADVGKVQVVASIPLFDGEPASSGTLSYPNVLPGGMPFPNSDVSFEPSTQTIVVTQGGVTSKCTEAGELF